MVVDNTPNRREQLLRNYPSNAKSVFSQFNIMLSILVLPSTAYSTFDPDVFRSLCVDVMLLSDVYIYIYIYLSSMIYMYTYYIPGSCHGVTITWVGTESNAFS